MAVVTQTEYEPASDNAESVFHVFISVIPEALHQAVGRELFKAEPHVECLPAVYAVFLT